MIHDPSNITLGTVADHQRTISELEAIATSMAGIYATAANQTPEQARADMLTETWLTPEEAVARGYADVIAGDPSEAAAGDEPMDVLRPEPEPAPFAYANYRHTPERIAALASAKGWNHSRPRAAASAHQRQPENPMATEPSAGAAAPAITPEPDALATAKADGRAEALAYVQEVTSLCDLAGAPEKATAFIEANTAATDVRKALLDARASADSARTIVPQPPTGAQAQAGGVDLAADMRRRHGIAQKGA